MLPCYMRRGRYFGSRYSAEVLGVQDYESGSDEDETEGDSDTTMGDSKGRSDLDLAS